MLDSVDVATKGLVRIVHIKRLLIILLDPKL